MELDLVEINSLLVRAIRVSDAIRQLVGVSGKHDPSLFTLSRDFRNGAHAVQEMMEERKQLGLSLVMQSGE